MDQGNLLGMVGSYGSSDGQRHEMVDVWFAKQAVPAPELGELLTEPAPDLLGGAATGAANGHAGSAAAAAQAGVEQLAATGHLNLSARSSVEEELMRLQQQNLL